MTPRSLTVTPEAASRLYGDANPASDTATANGLVNGDSISWVRVSSPAAATSAVGRYDLTASDAKGKGLSNYAISYATRTGGLTVTPRPVTVTADSLSKPFGAPVPSLTARVTAGGLAPFDPTIADALSNLTLTTPASRTSPAGRYPIDIGATSANYDLTLVGGILTVDAGSAPPASGFEKWPAPSSAAYRFVLQSLAGPGHGPQAGSQSAPCLTGVIGSACVSLPYPSNRSFGRWLSFRAR